MKKSSLGKKSLSSTARKTDFQQKSTGIPVLLRSKSGCNLLPRPTEVRRRNHSAERSSNISEIAASNETARSFRPMSGRGRSSSISTKKGDIRPLQEREWQEEALSMVLTTLKLDYDGFNICQTYKSLKPLTLSAFIDVCNHLIQRLGSNVEITKSNYLENLPTLLKKLMYKGKVDKMMLQTVNTPHNFPVALGIFHFLAELVLASSSFSEKFIDIAYNDFLELESSQTEDLKFKYTVPMFEHLWSRNTGIPIADLVEKNRDIVDQVIARSGLSSDGCMSEAQAQAEHDKCAKDLKEAKEKHFRILQQIKDADAEAEKLDEELRCKSSSAVVLEDQIALIEKNKQEADDEIKQLELQLRCAEEMAEELLKSNPVLADASEAPHNGGESLRDDIIIAKSCLHGLEEDLIKVYASTASLKLETNKLFNEYTTAVNELLHFDGSLKAAISYMKPCMGRTPCNQATAALLDKSLVDNRQLLSRIKRVSIDEEALTLTNLRERNAMLPMLKAQLASSTNQQAKLEQKLVTMEVELKENHRLYSEKETLFEQKSDEIREYFQRLQRLLEIREEVVNKHEKRRKQEIQDYLDQFKRLADVLELKKRKLLENGH